MENILNSQEDVTQRPSQGKKSPISKKDLHEILQEENKKKVKEKEELENSLSCWNENNQESIKDETLRKNNPKKVNETIEKQDENPIIEESKRISDIKVDPNKLLENESKTPPPNIKSQDQKILTDLTNEEVILLKNGRRINYIWEAREKSKAR
jgi:hypothetical protein